MRTLTVLFKWEFPTRSIMRSYSVDILGDCGFVFREFENILATKIWGYFDWQLTSECCTGLFQRNVFSETFDCPYHSGDYIKWRFVLETCSNEHEGQSLGNTSVELLNENDSRNIGLVIKWAWLVSVGFRSSENRFWYLHVRISNVGPVLIE